MSTPFIQLDAVVKTYGPIAALDHVSLNIAEGEFLALLGPSGCGKTTLLRALAGFTDITAGDILLEGKSIKRLPANKRPTNTVFQNYALFPHLTAAENIAYGPRRAGKSRKEAGQIVEEVLSIVGMSDFADRLPSMLSGGQQQRIALARAVANKPKVLLLDEPLSALDLKLRKQMQLELKHLHETLGTTFVFVTHDQEEALVMADRIAVMEAGRIAQIGRGEDIYHAPTERYVADFIGDANLIQARVKDGQTIITEAGTTIPAPNRLKSGDDVTYLLRPEAIEVDATPPGRDRIMLSAKVMEVVFLGHAHRVYLRADNGEHLVAQLGSLATTNVGDTVSLSWSVDAGKVLAK